MKPLAEYDWHDWQRLRPITHRLKTLRYNARRDVYVRRSARAYNLVLDKHIHGRHVLVTVAFDDAEAIDMQGRLIARFVPQAQYVIADNSKSDSAAAEIAAVAAALEIPYIRLPKNPWTRRQKQASRAHGLALNWVWRNVLLPGEPEMFGFLDDDMFPTAADDPFAVLEHQPVYGYCRYVGERWFLGGNFAFYRFDSVRRMPLDFGQDWFNGLDTGGGNWDALFRDLDRKKLEFVPSHFEPYKPGADPVQASIQWCGVWLHEVGQTRRSGLFEVAADKRRIIKEMLAPHLASSTNHGAAQPRLS